MKVNSGQNFVRIENFCFVIQRIMLTFTCQTWTNTLQQKSMLRALIMLQCCLSQDFYCCDKTPRPKSKLGRKEFVWLTLPHCSISLKETKAGTHKAETWEVGADAAAMEGELLNGLLSLYWKGLNPLQVRKPTKPTNPQAQLEIPPISTLEIKNPYIKPASCSVPCCFSPRQRQPLSCAFP